MTARKGSRPSPLGKPSAARQGGTRGGAATVEGDSSTPLYDAPDDAGPILFEDEEPGWSLERAAEEHKLGLHNSRPIDVYRHNDYPQHKRTIDQIISDLFRAESSQSETLVDAGIDTTRVSNGSVVAVDGVGDPDGTNGICDLWMDGLLRRLGYGSGPTAGPSYRKLRNHLRIVLLDSFVSLSQDPNQWIGYSRNDSRYLRQDSRYNLIHLSRQFLTQAIDLLAQHGYLLSWIPPKGRRGIQSRFRPTERLAALPNALPPDVITHDYSLREPIILMSDKDPKTKRAKPVEYQDEDYGGQPKVWRDNLAIINEHLAAAALGIDLDPETMQLERIDLTRNQIYRVFNKGDWNFGGRFYGAWWLQLKNRDPAHFRRHITIDGQPVVEVDYSQIHPTMLYVDAGATTIERDGVTVPIPGNGLAVPADSYAIPGLARDNAKTVFNTMLNVGSRQGIYLAVRNAAISDAKRDAKKEERRTGNPEPGESLAARVEERIAAYAVCITPIRERHSAIDNAFGTGIGLLLQNRDSQMAEAVMLNMVRRGVTVLPVHDSFIVKAEHEGLLLSIMDLVLHDFFPNLSRLSDGVNFKVTHADGRMTKRSSQMIRRTGRGASADKRQVDDRHAAQLDR